VANKFERVWKEAIVAQYEALPPEFSKKGLRKTTKKGA
jgi:hypothetical protein